MPFNGRPVHFFLFFSYSWPVIPLSFMCSGQERKEIKEMEKELILWDWRRSREAITISLWLRLISQSFSYTLIGHPQKLRLWQLFGGQSYVRKKKRLVSGGSRSACREQSLNTHIYIRRKKEKVKSKVTGCQSLCDQRAAALDFLFFFLTCDTAHAPTLPQCHPGH